MGPLARVLPKALWPLIDQNGRPWPVLHFIIRQALSAGIEHIGLIASDRHMELVQRYLRAFVTTTDASSRRRIECIVQKQPKGFGHAVACGADFVDGDPFMLLLGDHIHVTHDMRPTCAQQVVRAFAAQRAAAMVGVYTIGPDKLSSVGVAAGEHVVDSTYRCTEFVEKPDVDTARRRLVTEGLQPDEFLAHCGIYVFTDDIFECLRCLMRSNPSGHEEVELAAAQAMLLEQQAYDYYLVRVSGRVYDTGFPAGYLRAQRALQPNSFSIYSESLAECGVISI
jgi:UTP--glucose-1-phosphate uridylyltransferase